MSVCVCVISMFRTSRLLDFFIHLYRRPWRLKMRRSTENTFLNRLTWTDLGKMDENESLQPDSVVPERAATHALDGDALTHLLTPHSLTHVVTSACFLVNSLACSRTVRLFISSLHFSLIHSLIHSLTHSFTHLYTTCYFCLSRAAIDQGTNSSSSKLSH